MQIRRSDLRIDEEQPFVNCKLERKQYAEILTDIVGLYPQGFVLAIDNGWGTGKTTFIKMWRQHLINEGFKTVYFNAWENDFDLNPIVAILAELKSLVEKPTRKVFDDLTKNGSALVKAVLPAIAKAATKRYFDAEEVSNAIEGVAKAAAESFEAEIAEYKKKKESISGFRVKLQEFVSKSDSEKPIVFVIDELDRCRPTYAIEVLEQMKHFFAVRGSTFVLSIDKGHLAASVRGYYGSELINTDEYLRRFIDLEYSIPEPSSALFCEYLFDDLSFSSFFNSDTRKTYSAFNEDGKYFLSVASVVCDNTKITLRQMEKIFGRVRLILAQFSTNNYVLPECLFLIVYWSVIKPDFYRMLSGGRLKPQQICDAFAEVVSVKNEFLSNLLSFTEAILLVLYDNEFSPDQKLLYNDPETGKRTTSLVSKFEGQSKGTLIDVLSYVYQDFDKRHVRLSHLTKKVDLLEPLVTN